ncbi:MAG: NAD(P)H-hydrate dehydratase [Clostridia bacterium]|nr:NAD(P)H-hydrate dehydratase [Clostridia bacterium]
MERILLTNEMREIDDYNINKLGISSLVFIERAGNAVAEEIIKKFKGGRVLVCVGKGNNGEDAKIVAEILKKKHGFTVTTLNVFNGFFKLLEKPYDIIVDGIFGTGLKREVEGKYKEAIEIINNSGAYVVSIDIPSGLNGDTGMPLGVSVKANLTIAIQEYKLGHFINDGPDYCGKIICRDIGLSIWEENYIKRITNSFAKKFFTPRKRNVNKGSFGKTTVCGGSKNYFGSVLLSLNSLLALKMGVGYANLCVPKCLYSTYAGLNPECTISTINSADGNFVFNEEDVKSLFKYNSISFGMGIGVNEENYKIVKYILENYTGRLVIDADGLNTIAKYGLEILKNKKCEVVLTPHVKEFSRLVNLEVNEIKNNTIEIIKSFASEYNVILLLKDSASFITNGKEIYLNTTGNNSLAKAGSGDTLSGILAGILARGYDLLESVVVSCYLLGITAEIAVKNNNEYTVTATDIVKYLPNAINSL